MGARRRDAQSAADGNGCGEIALSPHCSPFAKFQSCVCRSRQLADAALRQTYLHVLDWLLVAPLSRAFLVAQRTFRSFHNPHLERTPLSGLDTWQLMSCRGPQKNNIPDGNPFQRSKCAMQWNGQLASHSNEGTVSALGTHQTYSEPLIWARVVAPDTVCPACATSSRAVTSSTIRHANAPDGRHLTKFPKIRGWKKWAAPPIRTGNSCRSSTIADRRA